MEKQETTTQELMRHGITRITEGSVLLLDTVTLRDNSQEVWLECVDDNGGKVRLVPDLTGWQDGRKEVTVMTCRSGKNRKLFFREEGASIIPHDDTLVNESAVKVLRLIPFPCLEWAALRAR